MVVGVLREVRLTLPPVSVAVAQATTAYAGFR